MGVGGERAGECATQVGRADGFQFLRELDGRGAGFDERQRAAVDGDDVRVDGAALPLPARERIELALAERCRDVGGAHPAIAVPLGVAVGDAHAVHHSVADEPVIVRPGVDRVGADAGVAAA
jgi:hypothetical protein